jgi:hypothetical protein
MAAQMAQPSVRTSAMAERNQSHVWDNVRASNARIAAAVAGSDATVVQGTSSYAKVFASAPVAKRIAEYGGTEMEQSILRELRYRGANGVVVAINGRVLWADVFASPELLAKYWPKLIRSYVAEAMTSSSAGSAPDIRQAERYISNLSGRREIAETEPGVYPRSDITGDGFRVFKLTSLLSKAKFEVHLTKIAER